MTAGADIAKRIKLHYTIPLENDHLAYNSKCGGKVVAPGN